MTQFLAITISRHQAKWDLPEIPWYNFMKDEDIPMLPEGGESGPKSKDYQLAWTTKHPGPRRYITYLAKKRNHAVKLALENYPDTSDVMMCDTYYVNQTDSLKRLISDYETVSKLGVTAALGGAAWGSIRTRLKHFINRPSLEWYDKWGVPDLSFTPFGWKPETDPVLGKILTPPLPGLFHTSSLTGVSIWPRSIWDKGTRYGVYDDLHGCEHNYFFEHSGILRYTDLNAVFWRNIKYPFIKALRCSLNLGRFSKHPSRDSDRFTVSEFDRMEKYKQ